MAKVRPGGFVSVVFLSVIVIGCGAEARLGTREPAATEAGATLEVQGLVVEVRGDSLTKVDSLSVRDEAGKLWTFTTEGFVGLTPSHLREHRALALPVTVRYRETPDGLLALSVTD